MVRLRKERFDYENLKVKLERINLFWKWISFEFESEGYKFSIHKDGRVFLSKINDIKNGFQLSQGY